MLLWSKVSGLGELALGGAGLEGLQEVIDVALEPTLASNFVKVSYVVVFVILFTT